MKVSSMLSMGSYVILQDGMVPMTISASEIRSLMPIRLPCRPHGYCHSNITKSTFYRIRTEFHRGHALTKDILRPDSGIHLFRRSMLLSKKDTKTYLFQSISLISKMRYHIQFGLLYMLPSARILLLSLTVVPAISIVVRQFGRFLRELPHSTQSAAAVAASIAEVCWHIAKV
ncbi:hypothetical protein CsSME_00032775 [Camellia sinensis var. sinensis]